MNIKHLAIICLTVLEAAALVAGLDGALFGTVVMAVAGIAGHELGKRSAK